MRPPVKNQSFGNLSHDSGVLEMDNRSSGHSRSASNATSCYSNDTGFNDQIYLDTTQPLLFGQKICRINTKSWIILISFILSLLACLCYAYLPILVVKILQTIINIEPNGEFYNFWIQSNEPTEVGIHFFHIENPWAVENGLEKLKIKETGRYYFNTIVPNYLENSFGLNLFSHFSYRGINDFLVSHNQTLFINVTIRELIYGYRLNILDTAQSYNSMFNQFGFDIMPTKFFPNNSFGIMNGRNGTPDGPYEMYTGFSNTQNKFGFIKTWNNKTKLDIWKKDSCNAINGTDGTIFPAGVTMNDRLDFFIPDICRSLFITFQEKSSYKGIETYLFSAPNNVLAGRHTNPDNECFCIEEDEELAEKRCVDGIFDLAGCQNGIPLIISLPHFLDADPTVVEQIEGLKPDPSKHRPELHIEPTMGLVIHGDSRLQMSIRVVPNENMNGFNKLRDELYIPIFWGYKKLGMSDDTARSLKLRLFTPIKIVKFILISLILGGLITSIYGFFRWIIFSKKLF
ncbi:CD36-like protein [Euroglyphus maynei]|uniref:CD36-like protein n=1 Tax=Euroglyphus maynei TaxID=6958 RepID=A0A1Y3AQ37_EURMA|nr:CD36-like protein [Euroglyphus maynei]